RIRRDPHGGAMGPPAQNLRRVRGPPVSAFSAARSEHHGLRPHPRHPQRGRRIARPAYSVIDAGEIAKLAELYDRYANAFQRLAPDRLQARRLFFARLEALYQQEGSAVGFEAFRFEMVKHCKEYLKKN